MHRMNDLEKWEENFLKKQVAKQWFVKERLTAFTF